MGAFGWKPQIPFGKRMMLFRCCPVGVFDVEDVPKLGKRAVVRSATQMDWVSLLELSCILLGS